MPANIGGVNVRVGVDLSKVDKGLKEATKHVKTFRDSLSKIRLEKAIKGNPFEATDKYLKASSKLINNVFSQWGNAVSRVDVQMDRFAKRSEKNATILTTAWGKIANKIDVVQKSEQSRLFAQDSANPLVSKKAGSKHTAETFHHVYAK